MTSKPADNRHRWSKPPVRREQPDEVTGCDYSERECYRCGTLMLTIHPPEGFPYPVWVLPTGERVKERTPPCKP